MGPNPDGAVAAFHHHGMARLVADYAVSRKLVTFEEAKKLLSSKDMEEKAFAARVAAGYPDRLGEVVNKQTMARVLAQFGCTDELRVLETHEGFLPEANIQKCLDAATEAGKNETAAYLLDLLARTRGAAGAIEGLKL